MAVAYKNAGTFTTSSVATLANVPLPTGLNNDDIVIAVGKDRGGTLVMDTGGANSDWTLIDSVDVSLNGMAAYWARKTGGVDPSLPDWSGGSNHIYAQNFAFSGCATSSSPIDAVGTERTDISLSTSVTGVSFNTATAGAMLVALVGSGNGGASSTNVYSSPDWADADVSGETIREQNASSVGADGSICLVTGDLANGPGATGAFTLTKTANDQSTALFFALKSASTTSASVGDADGVGAAAASSAVVKPASGSAGGVGAAGAFAPTFTAPGQAAGSGGGVATGGAIASASGSSGGSGGAIAALPVDLTPSSTTRLEFTGYSPGVEQDSPVISNFAFYVESGATGTSHSVTSTRFRGFTPGQGFYLSCLYKADRTTGVGVATLKMQIKWYGAAGPLTTTEHSISINADVADYVFAESRQVAPAGAVEGEVVFLVTPAASPMQHHVWIIEPRLGITQRGAEITKSITGPATRNFNYSYAGALDPSNQMPTSLQYQLLQGGVQITSGVTWTYLVKNGTVNGFTNGDGSQSMSGSGTGSLSLTSLGANEATVEITASYLGQSSSVLVVLTKVFALPPSGTTVNLATKSTFTNFSSTSFVDITGAINFTTPAGVTNVDYTMSLESSSEDSGDSTVEMKFQRLVAAVWTDKGVVQSEPTSTLHSFDPEEIFIEPATFNYTFNDTGLTGSTAYQMRVVARVTSGSRLHGTIGTVTVIND